MSEWINVRSYRPGQWFAVVGRTVIVLLPPSEKARVAPLWELIDAGAELGEVLDALISTGLRDLPAFVLLSAVEPDTTVVLRGPVSATVTRVGGELEITGEGAATWVEQSLTDVRHIVVDLVEELAEVSYRLDAGLVRVSRLEVGNEWRDVEPVSYAASASELEEEYAEEITDPTPFLPHLTIIGSESAPVAEPTEEEPEAEDEHEYVEAGDAKDALEDEQDDEQDAADLAGDAGDAGDPAADDLEPTAEPLREPPSWRPSTPAPPPPPLSVVPPPPPAGPPLPPPGLPPQVPPPPPPRTSPPVSSVPPSPGSEATGEVEPEPDDATTAMPLMDRPVPSQPQGPRLELSDGSTVVVDRPVLIGRSPDAGRATTDQEPLLHKVPSPQQEISATHIEIRPDGRGAVITDLGSTNGTVIALPGEPARELRPGDPVVLSPGTVIDLGDGLSIRVAD